MHCAISWKANDSFESYSLYPNKLGSLPFCGSRRLSGYRILQSPMRFETTSVVSAAISFDKTGILLFFVDIHNLHGTQMISQYKCCLFYKKKTDFALSSVKIRFFSLTKYHSNTTLHHGWLLSISFSALPRTFFSFSSNIHLPNSYGRRAVSTTGEIQITAHFFNTLEQFIKITRNGNLFHGLTYCAVLYQKPLC